MKSYRKALWFNVPGRRGFINITPQVDACLQESGIQEGLCLVNAMHITTSVFINDDKSGLHVDYEKWLKGLVPHAPISQYQHNRTGEACPEPSRRDNADAHLKRQVMGREVVVAVTDGRLDGSTELAEVFGTMVIVTTADPLYDQTGEQPWNHEIAILNLVGEFINASFCDKGREK